MNHTMRETAVNPALARRETREENPYERIVFAGTASHKFQILRPTWLHNKMKYLASGSFDSLEAAIAARDGKSDDEQRD